MMENKFNEFLVDSTMIEIKNYVFSQIILPDENCVNMDLQKEKADAVIRETLADILKKKKDSDDREYEYNYQTVLGQDEKTGEKLRMYLILYYTAIYFDNLELLTKILNCGFNFGLSPSPLCILDRRLSDLFEEEEYLQIIHDSYPRNIRKFYDSVKDEEETIRNEHLQKFSSFCKARRELILNKTYNEYEDDYPDILKNFPLNILLKISPDMFSFIRWNYCRVEEIKDKDRFFKLLECSNINLAVLKLIMRAEFFDVLTNEQILAFGEYPEYFTGSSWSFFCDEVQRQLNLCQKNIDICKYPVTLSSAFLKMFTDEEIISMNDEQLSYIQAKFDSAEIKQKDLHKNRIVKRIGKLNN